MRRVEVVANLEKVAERVADLFVAAARAATNEGDSIFRVALAGGSTPRALHQLLVDTPYREQVAWSQVEFYFGDERCVPPNDDDSNYAMALHTLFAPLAIPDDKVFRILGEAPPEEAAQKYDELLGQRLGPAATFDLILLGMGPDGHTASLFPGSPALAEQARRCIATVGPKPPPRRITLTLPVLSAAKQAIVMVTGAEKAESLAQALTGGPDGVPVGRVDAAEVIFIVDEAAGARAVK